MRPRLVVLLLLAAAAKCVARLDRPALGRQIAPSLAAATTFVAMIPLTSAPSPETRADMQRMDSRLRKRLQRLEDQVCRIQQSQLTLNETIADMNERLHGLYACRSVDMEPSERLELEEIIEWLEDNLTVAVCDMSRVIVEEPPSGGSSVYTDDGSVMPTDEMAAEFAEFDKEAALSKVARDAAQARAASIVSRACATRELFAFLGEQQADEEVERGAAEQQADEEVERGAASCRADSCRLLLTHAFRPRAARVCRRRPRLRAWQKRALAGMTKRCVAFA